jgi:hypothetical protein
MNIPRALLVSTTAAVTILSSAASAQNTASTDVRCLVLSTRVAGVAKDAKAKEIGTAAKFYYLGRVSLLTPAEVQAGKAAFPKQMEAGPANQMMKQCFDDMQANGKKLENALR